MPPHLVQASDCAGASAFSVEESHCYFTVTIAFMSGWNVQV
jgi:hypothetical protein